MEQQVRFELGMGEPGLSGLQEPVVEAQGQGSRVSPRQPSADPPSLIFG